MKAIKIIIVLIIIGVLIYLVWKKANPLNLPSPSSNKSVSNSQGPSLNTSSLSLPQKL